MPKKTTKTTRTNRQTGVLTRSAVFDRASVNEENRTAELAFSSENPVLRWGENEVLDHGEGSIRLDRASQGLPLLADHNWSDQIGIAENITVDSDRVGRATVRFSKSARGEEIFNDVKDGIRKDISVGYRIYRAIREEMAEEVPDTLRVVDWEPLEVSFVSVPADTSVGVGRASEDSETNNFVIEQARERNEDTMPNENQDRKPAEPVITQEQREAVINETQTSAREAEEKRIQGIRSVLALQPDFEAEARDAIREGVDVNTFADQVVELALERSKDAKPATNLDLSQADKRSYSICRAIDAMANNDWSRAGFELECSQEIAKRLGADAKGMYVPFDVQEGERVVDTTTAAGAIGTSHMPASFIDTLRDRSLLIGLGMRTMGGLRENVSIPRKTGNSTHTWVGEGGSASLSDVTVGALTMTPHTVVGATSITRRTLKQATPDMDAIVMEDLAEGAALAIDIGGLAGDGTGNNPLGVLNTTGVLTQLIGTAAAPTWAEIVGFESTLAAANALADRSQIVTTAAMRGTFKTTSKDSGSGRFIMENGEVNGYPVSVKTDSGWAANTILQGDFSQVIMGMWGVVDMVVDTATLVSSNGIVIRVFQDLDFAVRQPTAFCKNTSV